MVTKILFLVLLGISLVLASPIPEENYQEVSLRTSYEVIVRSDVPNGEEESKSVELDFAEAEGDNDVTTLAPIHEGKWDKLKSKWIEIVESGKKKWTKITEKWNKIKQNGLKIIDEAKKSYEEIKGKGEEAIDEFKKIYKTVRETWADMKKTGKETYEDIKAALDEIKVTMKEIKEKFAELKEIG